MKKYLISLCQSQHCPADRLAKTLSDRAPLALPQGSLKNYPELLGCGAESFLLCMPEVPVKRIDIHRLNGWDLSRRNRCRRKITRVKRAAESRKAIQFSNRRTKESIALFQVQRHSLFLPDVFVTAIGHHL